MSNYFLGQITMAAFNFPPKNWALCNGQTLSISQNAALFALLGTTYGGNGVTTFALPNLQSCLPVHQGQGSGLSSYVMGQTGGSASVTLNQSIVPGHTHTLTASTTGANSASISSGEVPGTPSGVSGGLLYATGTFGGLLSPVSLDSGVMSTVGGSQSHTNLMPSLCITFIIALSGIFPSRN